MRTLFDSFMALAAAVLVLFAVVVLTDAFGRSVLYSIFLWLWLPTTAYWFCTTSGQALVSLRQLKIIRVVLLGLLVLVSIPLYDGHRLSDFLGHHFIDGYSVGYHEEYKDDDLGNSELGVSTDYNASTWLGRLSLFLIRFLAVALPILLFYLTWRVISKAIDMKESTDQLSN